MRQETGNPNETGRNKTILLNLQAKGEEIGTNNALRRYPIPELTGSKPFPKKQKTIPYFSLLIPAKAAKH